MFNSAVAKKVGWTGDESPLFAARPIAGDFPGTSAIVVGLPRSGSTFLTHVLSHLPGWWFFDDLYFYQQVRAVGAADGPLDARQIEHLLDWVRRRIWAGIRWPKFESPQLSYEELDRFIPAVRGAIADRPTLWHELMREMLTRLAVHHGAARWGYKTPQDFMHLAELRRIYPELKVIYLFRDPRDVLASYKFNHTRDGKPGQYHPLVYALYWKLAAETFERTSPQFDGAMLEVRFERLIADPQAEARRLAAFLGTAPPSAITDAAAAANSTFRNGHRSVITNTEAWICERVAAQSMRRRGYTTHGVRPSPGDVPDLMAVTARFLHHQATRVLGDLRARHSLGSFVRRLIAQRTESSEPNHLRNTCGGETPCDTGDSGSPARSRSAQAPSRVTIL